MCVAVAATAAASDALEAFKDKTVIRHSLSTLYTHIYTMPIFTHRYKLTMHDTPTCRLCRTGKFEYVRATLKDTQPPRCEHRTFVCRGRGYYECEKSSVARQTFEFGQRTDTGELLHAERFDWHVCVMHLNSRSVATSDETVEFLHRPISPAAQKST